MSCCILYFYYLFLRGDQGFALDPLRLLGATHLTISNNTPYQTL